MMRVNKFLSSVIAFAMSLTVFFLSASCSGYSSNSADPSSRAVSALSNAATVITSDPSTSVKLIWQGTLNTVQYVINPSTGSPDFTGAPTVTAVATTVHGSQDRTEGEVVIRPDFTYHEIILTGLTPNTLYAYKIGETVNTFKTAPADGSFGFIYFSDPQVTRDEGLGASDTQTVYLTAAFNDIRNNIKNTDAYGNKPALACITGDFTDYYGNDEFNVLFNAGQYFFANTLIAGAEGNHDYNTEVYSNANYFLNDYFGFPSTQTTSTLRNTYSFDYGVAHFIVLNSNYIFESNNTPIATITTWLTNDLAASRARGKAWNIVLTHGSAYCAGDHAPDVNEIADTYASLFQANGVDIVLSGHDHNYARGFIKYSSSASTKGVKVTAQTVGGNSNSVLQPSDKTPFYMTGGTMGDCKWYALNSTYAKLFDKADALNNTMSYNYIQVNNNSVQINTRTQKITSSAPTTWTDYNTYTISKNATQYTITASAGSNGAISPSGSVSVSDGASQTFTITPNSGYSVSSVLVDGTSQGAITTYTFPSVHESHTISASFAAIPSYIITATANSGGSISPSGSVSVTQGASKTFAITPNSGYSVSSVLVDGMSQGAITTYTFNNVNGAHSITASFTAAATYTITASAGSNGSISPSGSVVVTQGASQTFTITPSSGYAVSSVTVDGTSQGAITSYTFPSVTISHTISATFVQSSSSNIAPSGTGYVWKNNTSATSNSNRSAKTGVNNNNLTTNVDISSGDSANRWEAAGVVFSSTKTITSVTYYSGDVTSGGDGYFEANAKLQFSTNGTTWTDSGWTVSPAFVYTNTDCGKTFVFSGSQISGIKGVRVVGQVRVNDGSYYARVKEVQIFGQ